MALTTGFSLPKFNWRRGKQSWDRHTWLYVSVLLAVVLGAVVGLVLPEVGQAFEPLGKGFRRADQDDDRADHLLHDRGRGGVHRKGGHRRQDRGAGAAVLHDHVHLRARDRTRRRQHHPPRRGTGHGLLHYDAVEAEAKTTQEFILGIIPTTFFSAFTGESVLQVLFIALLVGFALQGLGDRGAPIMEAVKQLQKLVFRILGMILWLAPLGAFGAIAAVVGKTGVAAIWSLGTLMIAFYITCILFIVVILGVLLWTVTRVNIFALMKYLAREYLLIVGTSSSESALPRLIAKMEFVGVSKPVVGITVPTGYSFNLDGTAIYLTMASLFIATGMGQPMTIGEQIGLLVFMIIASKGAAGSPVPVSPPSPVVSRPIVPIWWTVSA